MSLFSKYISEYLDEDNEHQKHTVVTSFDMPDANIDEVTVVPNANLGCKCDIRVYSGEGATQHFHIEGPSIDCCIMIFKPKYFVHGHHNDKLSAKQVKALDAILKSNKCGKSVWAEIVKQWYLNNPYNPTRYPDIEKDRTDKMPDYLNKLNSNVDDEDEGDDETDDV